METYSNPCPVCPDIPSLPTILPEEARQTLELELCDVEGRLHESNEGQDIKGKVTEPGPLSGLMVRWLGEFAAVATRGFLNAVRTLDPDVDDHDVDTTVDELRAHMNGLTDMILFQYHDHVRDDRDTAAEIAYHVKLIHVEGQRLTRRLVKGFRDWARERKLARRGDQHLFHQSSASASGSEEVSPPLLEPGDGGSSKNTEAGRSVAMPGVKDRGEQGSPVQDAKGIGRPAKIPTDRAFMAYKLHKLMGMTQIQTARRMTEEGVPIAQGTVSIYTREVNKFLANGGILPALDQDRPTVESVDPNVLDMGKRTDPRKPRPSDVQRHTNSDS